MVDRPPIHLPEILHTCQVLPSAHRRYLQHTGATFISTQALPSAHRRYSFLQHTGASFSTQVLPSAHRRFLQHTGASFSTQALPSAHRRYLQHTGATATGARLLDLHRSFSHHTSHTTQPPSFCAVATTVCVAARAAMPNSEEGSVVCCVPSCPDCNVKS